MKKTFYARIADINWKIEYKNSYVYERYKDYEIEAVKDAIELKADTQVMEAMKKEKPAIDDGYCEGDCFYLSIANIIPLKKRMLMHGAVISYNEDAYMFTAPGGTGKTTHISLWRKYLGEKIKIVNGDKPILAVEPDGVFVYGTPWGGKENWQSNCKKRLKAVCLLQRANENSIRRINPAEYFSMLIQQVYLPKEKEAAEKTLELLDELLKKMPFYLLGCDMSEDAVRCSFEELTGLKMEDSKK